MKKTTNKKSILACPCFNRMVVVTLIYILVGTIVWSTLARVFPDGIQTPWLLGLVIGLSIAVYLAAIILVEVINRKRVR